MSTEPSTFPPRIAYSITKAAEAVCVSEKTIRRAIAVGDLVAHVRASKQLVLAEDLRAWVEAGATGRP